MKPLWPSLLLLCVAVCFAQVGPDAMSKRRHGLMLAKNTATAAPEFPSTDLFQYWPMSEAVGNPRVDVVNSGDFTETTGTVDSTTGKNGDAANWAPSTGTLNSGVGLGDLAGTFSVSFWLNVDNAPIANVDIQNGNGTENFIIQLTSGRVLEFRTTTDGVLASSSALTLDTWNHVCATHSGSGFLFYVNGSSLGGPFLPTNPFDDTSIILGTIATLDAAIDEYGVWTRAINSTEVGNIWNGGTGTFYTP